MKLELHNNSNRCFSESERYILRELIKKFHPHVTNQELRHRIEKAKNILKLKRNKEMHND